jgi:putative membrane protein
MVDKITLFVIDYYLWIKAFHVIAVVAWMAGLFYLPRLFVYHVESSNRETQETLAVMERRLYKMIIMPAMHVALLLGGLLLFIPGFLQSGYMHIKILCVLLLIVFQFYLQHCHKQLVRGLNKKTSRFFRIINEIPTLLLIIIVICVIVKPFS